MKITLIFVALVYAANCYSKPADNNSHKPTKPLYEGDIKINIQKQSYLLGEPVWVELEYINFSEPGPNVSNSILKHSLNLYDENGDEIIGRLEPSAFPAIRTLKLNESVAAGGDLLKGFGKCHEYTGLEKGGFHMLPPGRYAIQSYLAGLYSNRIEFNILEPQGMDKAAFELFDEASKKSAMMFSNYRNASKEQRKIDALNYENAVLKLAQKYPHHIYTQSALYKLFVHGRATGRWDLWGATSFIDQYHKFYQQFPNSPIISMVVEAEQAYYLDFHGPERAFKELQKLTQSSYSAAVNGAAQRILERNRDYVETLKEK